MVKCPSLPPCSDDVLQGFESAQMGMLEDSELDAKAREKEILHVADSIKDLQVIFKELAVLVIDQV